MLGRVPDGMPSFWFSLCSGCQPTQVVTPIPGYVAGSRNFGSCLPQLVDPSGPTPSNSFPTLSPTSTTLATYPTSLLKPPDSLTTTAFVTAEIVIEIEIISTCSFAGMPITIVEQSTTCTTYETCVTIPATLCDTYISILANGDVTTYTAPIPSWEAILLPNEIRSTAQMVASSEASTEFLGLVAPPGYTAIQNVSPSSPIFPGASEAPSTTDYPLAHGTPESKSQSSPTQQTAYLESGGSCLAGSPPVIFLSLLGLAMLLYVSWQTTQSAPISR